MKKILNIAALIAITAFVAGCNKPFDNTLSSEENSSASAGKDRKVLFIMVDGAVGTEVQAAAPPNLRVLEDFSMYSWDAMNNYANTEITNELGWTTLLTGVNSDKHGVVAGGLASNNLDEYPSLFTRIKTEKPNLRTVAVGINSDLINTLAADATEKKIVGDDAAVKDAVVAELGTQDPKLLFTQFRGVDLAGLNGGYNNSNINYKNAILKTDEYIGDILTAMRNRPAFEKENWLVIIASSKGSNTPYVTEGQWSAFEDKRHNTFFFAFNPRFQRSYNPRPPVLPYLGVTQLYSGHANDYTSRQAKAVTGGSLYDFGASGNFTIQCKVKVPTSSANYATFLAKRETFGGSVPGWVFFREGDFWMINFGRSGGSNRQIRGHAIADGNWHTCVAVIKHEGNARNVYTYTDGVLYNNNISLASRNITDWGNLNTETPLTVGTIKTNTNNNFVNYMVTDVRIYNTDLSASYIANNYCRTDISEDDPYRENLLGFWPSTEVVSEDGVNKFLDHSGNDQPLTISTLSQGTFSDVTANVCPPLTPAIYRVVPQSVDAAIQIYEWLGILAPQSWQLDGKYWIPKYADLTE